MRFHTNQYLFADCGGTPVPLLSQVESGTTTIGCASYTTQPSSSTCPTAAPVVPTAGGPGGSRTGIFTNTSVPLGATVVTSVVSGTTLTETFVLTTLTQFSALTTPTITVISGAGKLTTLTVGPSGNAWIPFNTVSGGPNLAAPSSIPQAPAQTTGPGTSGSSGTGVSQTSSTQPNVGPSSSSSLPAGTGGSQPSNSTQVGASSSSSSSSLAPGTGGSQPSSSSQVGGSSSSQSLPPGATVEVGTVGTAVYTEVFVPTVDPQLSSLTGTITTTTFDAQSSPITLVIGPGGVEWTPINLPSGQPEINPPPNPPVNPNTPSVTGPTQTHTTGSSTDPGPSSTGQTTNPAASSSATASYASITGAFANPSQSETTIVIGGVMQHLSKKTFSDLTTLTAPTTITTPMVETNSDGSKFTISAAIIIVGPGGAWWNGGTGGFGIHGPSCIWPFCPPGGGGDVGGGGSGNDPKDPNTPGSNEQPSDPDHPDDNQSQSQQQSTNQPTSTGQTTGTTSSASPSSSSASCTLSTIVSDCVVSCATSTGASSATCSTSCAAAITACSAQGTTQYTTASGDSCTKPSGWANVGDGDDFSDYQPLGSAGIATPHSGDAGSTSAGTGSVSGSNTAGVTETNNATSTGTNPAGPTSSTAAGPGPSASGTTATPTTGSPSTSSAPATTSSVPPPDCMADGAPWYSPTSWCDCGATAKYPTLPPVSGQTSANCAYTQLPDSTINPISISAAPTNIPGVNGVPGCAAVVSVPGTSAYCNCGGTPAPTLSTTNSYINCDYTIQPTSSYDPAIPPPPSAAPPPAQTQKCNVHVWQGLGALYTDPEVVLDANITDASGNSIGHGQGTLDWGKSLNVDSQLPNVLVLTPQTGISSRVKRSLDKRIGVPAPPGRPLFEKGPLQFAYGGQSWDTSSSQCSVGGYDNGDANNFFGSLIFGDDYISNRQMDCKFDCVVLNSKRSVHVDKREPTNRFRDLSQEIAVRDPTLTDRSPSPVDDDLLEYRDLSKRASSLWVKYAASGAKYYQNWQQKTGDDIVYQCNFDEQFNVLSDAVKKVPPAMKIRPVLSSLGYSTGREYYAISLTGPKGDAPIADFTNTISASQGVFLANANDRGALPSDPTSPNFSPAFPQGRDPVPWQFSTVAWAMWQRTVLADNPQWAQNPSQADYSGLKAFFRREIDNADTKALLGEAFAGTDLTSTLTWTPDDPDQNTNAFWPLLGSPNGNGMIYIITDNKVALGGKGIKSIQATTIDSDGVKYFTMWANYG